MKTRIAAWVVFAGTLAAGNRTIGAPAIPRTQAALTKPAEYVVYYWRAKPGQLAAYNDYIKNIAEPVDESARKAGVFDEVHTYLSSATDSSPGDWTHVRVFKLGNGGTPEALSAGLDAAGKRMQPDEGARARNSARAADLREFVKREVWNELK